MQDINNTEEKAKEEFAAIGLALSKCGMPIDKSGNDIIRVNRYTLIDEDNNIVAGSWMLSLDELKEIFLSGKYGDVKPYATSKIEFIMWKLKKADITEDNRVEHVEMDFVGGIENCPICYDGKFPVDIESEKKLIELLNTEHTPTVGDTYFIARYIAGAYVGCEAVLYWSDAPELKFPNENARVICNVFHAGGISQLWG